MKRKCNSRSWTSFWGSRDNQNVISNKTCLIMNQVFKCKIYLTCPAFRCPIDFMIQRCYNGGGQHPVLHHNGMDVWIVVLVMVSQFLRLNVRCFFFFCFFCYQATCSASEQGVACVCIGFILETSEEMKIFKSVCICQVTHENMGNLGFEYHIVL